MNHAGNQVRRYTVNVLKFRILFSSSNKILVFRAEIHKMLFRIANKEDPDQTVSLIWVYTVRLGLLGNLCSKFYLPYGCMNYKYFISQLKHVLLVLHRPVSLSVKQIICFGVFTAPLFWLLFGCWVIFACSFVFC